MGGGGWKRVTLESNKERFVQKKSFWFVKKADFQLLKDQSIKKSFL